MKKLFLIFTITLLSLFSFNLNVSAKTWNLTYDNGTNYSNDVEKEKFLKNEDIIKTMFTELYDYYVQNFKETYPYYYFGLYSSGNDLTLSLNCFDNIVTISPDVDGSSYWTSSSVNYNELTYRYNYRSSDHSLIKPFDTVMQDNVGRNISNSNRFYHFRYFYSNFDLKISLPNESDEVVVSNYKTFHNGDIIEPVMSYLELDFFKDPNLPSSSQGEIDLNSYPYVVLSLKDYNQTKEFNTTVQVKGQYCLTPVYNYGMTEKKDLITGSKNQRCSLYYDNYTPVRTYILESDLKNHAIYYLKSYDTSKENKVKVDTSVFNITYITEENKDNPYITIDGRTYPIIPYDKLTDTATKSEEENYVSGASCRVGDFNCTASVTGNDFSFSDIFTSPLEFLKDIWQSIVNVFIVIDYFISLLPTTLQYFLFFSFMLAVILGLIKIII